MLIVFDTQFGVQGMENIGEIWYCLVPFLTQGGPSSVLVLVASNKVVLFFNGVFGPWLWKEAKNKEGKVKRELCGRHCNCH